MRDYWAVAFIQCLLYVGQQNDERLRNCLVLQGQPQMSMSPKLDAMSSSLLIRQCLVPRTRNVHHSLGLPCIHLSSLLGSGFFKRGAIAVQRLAQHLSHMSRKKKSLPNKLDELRWMVVCKTLNNNNHFQLVYNLSKTAPG